MAKHKVIDVGAKVNWPKNQKMPQSIAEALRLGFKITHSDCETATADESFERGTATLEKVTARFSLRLKIPYQALFQHGNPHSPKAHTAKTRYVTTEQIRAGLDAR